jgi:hypothetical protein
MAHKGNPYKVLYRRDWNLNVTTNRVGWGNYYYCRTVAFGTGFGTFVRDQIWECGSALTAPGNVQLWASDPRFIMGFQFHVEITVGFETDQASYRKRGKLFEDHYGVICIWRIGSDGTRTPGFDWQFGGTTLFADPAWFDSDPFMSVSPITVKKWTDPAPH